MHKRGRLCYEAHAQARTLVLRGSCTSEDACATRLMHKRGRLCYEVRLASRTYSVAFPFFLPAFGALACASSFWPRSFSTVASCFSSHVSYPLPRPAVY